MLIGVVGLNGSGKDAVALILKNKHGFIHKDIGQAIRDELKLLGKNHLDRNEMILLGNERRQNYGADYWAKLLLNNYNPKTKFVLTSIRNPSEAEELINRNGLLVEVFCDIKTRYARTIERVKNNVGAHGDVISFEDFFNKEEIELKNPDPNKQQLLKCISFAKIRINNNGSLKDLEKQVDNLVLKERNRYEL